MAFVVIGVVVCLLVLALVKLMLARRCSGHVLCEVLKVDSLGIHLHTAYESLMLGWDEVVCIWRRTVSYMGLGIGVYVVYAIELKDGRRQDFLMRVSDEDKVAREVYEAYLAHLKRTHPPVANVKFCHSARYKCRSMALKSKILGSV